MKTVAPQKAGMSLRVFFGSSGGLFLPENSIEIFYRCQKKLPCHGMSLCLSGSIALALP